MMSDSALASTSGTWAIMQEAIATTSEAIIVGLANSTEPTVSTETTLSTLFLISECDSFNADYKILPGCVCTVAAILGVMFCFFGYRLFKGTMFTTGFIFGSSIVYFVCFKFDVLPFGGRIGLSVGAGLLCGLTAIFIYYIGIFVVGFNFGFLLAVAGLVVLEQFYHPFTEWIPIGVILSIAVVCALLTLYLQKGLTMVGTGMLGAALILVGVDYFLNSSRVSEYAHDRLTGRRSTVLLCLYGWLIFGFWPALTISGTIVQWRITGVKWDHKKLLKGPVSTNRGKSASQLCPTDDDPESQDLHYRQLYRIRRVNGDVISKNYMQSVQQQNMQSVHLLNGAITEDTTTAVMTPITDIDS